AELRDRLEPDPSRRQQPLQPSRPRLGRAIVDRAHRLPRQLHGAHGAGRRRPPRPSHREARPAPSRLTLPRGHATPLARGVPPGCGAALRAHLELRERPRARALDRGRTRVALAHTLTGEPWCSTSRHRAPSSTNTFVAATREPESSAVSAAPPSSGEPWAWRMFSSRVTHAVAPHTTTCSSVRTNWMKLVLRKIASQEPATFCQPRSVGHPGCVTTTRSERSHTSAITSRSHASKAA